MVLTDSTQDLHDVPSERNPYKRPTATTVSSCNVLDVKSRVQQPFSHQIFAAFANEPHLGCRSCRPINTGCMYQHFLYTVFGINFFDRYRIKMRTILLLSRHRLLTSFKRTEYDNSTSTSLLHSPRIMLDDSSSL